MPERPVADERAPRLAALRRLDGICNRACDEVDDRIAAEAGAPTPGDTPPGAEEPPPAE